MENIRIALKTIKLIQNELQRSRLMYMRNKNQATDPENRDYFQQGINQFDHDISAIDTVIGLLNREAEYLNRM